MDSESSTLSRYSSRDIFGAMVALVMGICSLAAWHSFFGAVRLPDITHIITALFWFSLLAGTFLVGIVVWNKRIFLAVVPLLVFVPGFLYVQTWYFGAAVILASLLLYWSWRTVHDEMTDRLRFRFFHHARAGVFPFIMSISLVLSVAYFTTIRSASWEELVPRFGIGQGSAALIIQAVAKIYPEWQSMADTEMTVDGFLLSLQRQDGSELTRMGTEMMDPTTREKLVALLRQNVSEGEGAFSQEAIQESYLRAGREQIAQLVEMPVQGDEMIADVFTAAIQHKIVAILSGDQAARHFSPAIIPVLLALFLFLTLLPLGSVLSVFWLMLSLVIFRTAFFFGWVQIERVVKEQEILKS